MSGDENRRLGFNRQWRGTDHEDKDVYSFVGVAGTQVWIDLDRTASSLDSVIELIDANGIVLALYPTTRWKIDGYDCEIREHRSIECQFRRIAQPVRSRCGFEPSEFGDDFSTNTKDAGMRITLPGAVGERNLYHIRVRSSSVASSTSDADRIAH